MPQSDRDWISVEDRLPEHDRRVLCIVHGYPLPQFGSLKRAGGWGLVRRDGIYMEMHITYPAWHIAGRLVTLNAVTHWFPLTGTLEGPAAPTTERFIYDFRPQPKQDWRIVAPGRMVITRPVRIRGSRYEYFVEEIMQLYLADPPSPQFEEPYYVTKELLD